MPAGHDLLRIRLRYMTGEVKQLTVRLGDGSGQIHQKKGVVLTSDGQWHDSVLAVSEFVGGEHWAGANDGQWHSPAKLLSINMGTFLELETKKPALYLADIRRGDLRRGDDRRQRHAQCRDDRVAYRTVEVIVVSRDDYGFKLITAGSRNRRSKASTVRSCTSSTPRAKTVYDDDHAPADPHDAVERPGRVHARCACPAGCPETSRSLDALAEGAHPLRRSLQQPGPETLIAGQGVAADGGRRYRIGTLVIDNSTPILPLGPKTLDLAGYEITFSEEFDGPCACRNGGRSTKAAPGGSPTRLIRATLVTPCSRASRDGFLL